MNIADTIINGFNFQKIANLVLAEPGHVDISSLNDGDIIFCKTDYVLILFETLRRVNKDHRYKLITHCSDYSIDQHIFNFRPKCIYKWFAQNADFQHPDLIPIPIGLENHTGYSKGGYIDVEVLASASDIQCSNDLVYCNFSLHTHFNRRNVKKILADNPRCVFDQGKTFQQYRDAMQQCRFVASPRGNGIDCHRTWEALYFGRIPVVERHFMYDAWNFLPIIQIDDWNQLDAATGNVSNALFDKKYLDINYWFSFIKNYAC